MRPQQIADHLFWKAEPHGFMAVSYIEPVNMDAIIVTLWRSDDRNPTIIQVSGLELLQGHDEAQLKALLDDKVTSALALEVAA